MTTTSTPRLKSNSPTPDRARAAETPDPTTGRSAPKAAARQGVPSAGLPDPRPAAEPRVIGWLHIVCPSDWRAPVSATSHCDCGRHVTARTRPDVIALVTAHHDHRAHCPLHTAPERRQAA
ncbi:hypothetical protein [Streptomyces sp. CA-111067]|uniref:hypothetical protein n=1 Tax=Streptomyces sp. CA-111067 TaxID=3240046 RepID=UPI003D95F64C